MNSESKSQDILYPLQTVSIQCPIPCCKQKCKQINNLSNHLKTHVFVNLGFGMPTSL